MKKTKNIFLFDYVEENVNPHKVTCADCAIRAIAKLLHISWERAYRLLFRVALKRKNTATHIQTIVMAMEKAGCDIVGLDIPLVDYVPKAGERVLIMLDENNDGHAIYVKGNKYYDTEKINHKKYRIAYEISRRRD